MTKGERQAPRRYDAIHLASALELKAVLPPSTPVVFSAADEALCEAEKVEGLV